MGGGGDGANQGQKQGGQGGKIDGSTSAPAAIANSRTVDYVHSVGTDVLYTAITHYAFILIRSIVTQ